MRILGWVTVVATCLLICSEIALRALGVLDFPLFTPGPPYGYIPQPSQSGAFLNKNDWVFNELSMGVSRSFEPATKCHDEILLGDSIVSGGNPYRQSDRLGVRLEEATHHVVWPISANSWGLSNELTYLEHHPEVVAGADSFTFVLNSKDLAPASVWTSEKTHPTHRPLSATAYLIAKAIPSQKPQTPPHTSSWLKQWSKFTTNIHKPIRIVLYPTKAESADPALRRRRLVLPFVNALSRPGIDFVDIGARNDWNTGLYRDDLHPTPEGTRRLAEALANSSTNFEATTSKHCQFRPPPMRARQTVLRQHATN